MRVISRRALREFARAHPDAEGFLNAWWKVAEHADWSSIRDVRRTYPHADAVTLSCGIVVTVFNVCGNKYRMVVEIIYDYRRVYVRRLMTHAEYDKEKWKAQLCQG